MKGMICFNVIFFLSSISFAGERKIVVDLSKFNFKVYEGDKIVREGITTGGRAFCPDIQRGCRSPIGEFKVLVKKGRWYRSPLYPVGCSNAKGSKNLCASMAFSVKFKYSGESFHASNKDDWNKPKNISHGCLHLKMEDAKWINEWAKIGDSVIILPY